MAQRTLTGSSSFDGAGGATVTLSNSSARQSWRVVTLALSATSGQPIAQVYRNTVAPSNLLGGTFTGQLDTGKGSGELIRPAEALVVRWTGGVTGASATAVLTYDDLDAWSS